MDGGYLDRGQHDGECRRGREGFLGLAKGDGGRGEEARRRPRQGRADRRLDHLRQSCGPVCPPRRGADARGSRDLHVDAIRQERQDQRLVAGRRRSAVGPQLDRREWDDGRTVPGGRTPRLARARRHPERPRPADRDHPPGYERRRSAGAGGEVSEVDGDDLREVPGQRHDPGGHDGAAAEARPGGPDRALQRGARGPGEEARPAAGGLPRRDPRPAAGRGLAGHADQRRRRPSDKRSRCRSGDAREPGEGRLSAPLLAQPAQGDGDQGQGARWGGRRGQDGARPARQGAEASCCAGSRRACHSGRHRLPGVGASPAPARGKRRPRAERCRTPAGRGGPQARTDDPDRPGRLPNAAVARDSECRRRCDPRCGW